jgi:hypothetical protein
MFDQVLETFRKATESTLQMQQQMYRQWTQQWMQVPWLQGMPSMPSMPWMSGMPSMPWMSGMAGMPWMQGMPGLSSTPAGPWLEQLQAVQKQAAAAVTDMLKKHRDTLDTQYATGIRTIEEAFRLGQAKDPDQLRRLTEELWKQSFDCLRTVSESQTKEFQGAVETWFENVSKGAAAMKV